MTIGIQRLGPADLGLLLDLQEKIHAAQPDPDTFQRSTPEFLAYCLADGGRCYRAVHGDETVAYRIVYFPRERPFNLAIDTTVPAAEYGTVAHFDTIGVLPDWRGHGLARRLNSRALTDLADTGTRHILATSAPTNPYGVRALTEAGARAIGVVEKFGGKLRLLFYRPYPQAWPAAPATGAQPVAAARRHVALVDTAALVDAFRQGWVGDGVRFAASGAADLRMVRSCLPVSLRTYD